MAAATSANRRYGVGVVGLGVQGRALRDDLAASPRLTVAATFDPRAPAAERGLRRSSVAAVCADPAVDVVYVASPPAAHEVAVLLAAAGGKAVLCEKPLAADAAVARRLAAAVREARVPGAVNFYLATAPAGRGLAAALADGRLGAIERIELRARFRTWPRPWQAAAGGWLASPAEGGFTREVVSHFVFLADRLVGPGAVDEAFVLRGDDGLEQRLEARLVHGGVPFSIDASLGGDADESIGFTVTCAGGEVAIVDWDALVGAEPDRSPPVGVAAALVALLDGEPSPLPDLEAGARVVAVVEQLLS